LNNLAVGVIGVGMFVAVAAVDGRDFTGRDWIWGTVVVYTGKSNKEEYQHERKSR
jgi:hypothetical protein